MISRSMPIALVLVLVALSALIDPVTAAGGALAATLNGASEVDGGGNPNQGDPDGSGTAQIILKVTKRKICFDLSVSAIQLPATAAHIHEAVAGQNGPPIVTLDPPDATGQATGCLRANRGLIKRIKANPAGFYVNVHNGEFSGGAIRGQLAPAA